MYNTFEEFIDILYENYNINGTIKYDLTERDVKYLNNYLKHFINKYILINYNFSLSVFELFIKYNIFQNRDSIKECYIFLVDGLHQLFKLNQSYEDYVEKMIKFRKMNNVNNVNEFYLFEIIFRYKDLNFYKFLYSKGILNKNEMIDIFNEILRNLTDKKTELTIDVYNDELKEFAEFVSLINNMDLILTPKVIYSIEFREKLIEELDDINQVLNKDFTF